MAAESKERQSVPLLIDGEDIQAKSQSEVTAPATGKVAYTYSNSTAANALAAVDAAHNAFSSWSTVSPSQRRDILLKAAQLLDARRDELIDIMKEETGASPAWAGFNIATTRSILVDCAARLATIEGRIPTLEDPKYGAMVVKEPFGVVFAMAPWNAPYILGLRCFVWPIAAGNTVVFKGSELSPLCHYTLCSIFREAGLPAGVLNFIVAPPANAPSVTAAVISSPKVKKINFTGSTPVGRIIARLAGENLKPVLLELGGKAPAIVWEDADLELAARACTLGSFLHGGQICMSTERIVVHKAVRAAFEEKLVATAKEMFATKAVLISAAAVDKNQALVKDALSKGAELVYGAVEATAAHMQPVIVGKVTPDMDIYMTESFGPSVSILEVETEQDALRIANDTEYGLTSAVFTGDLRRGLRLARQIETGAVHINSMTVHDEPALPHGGAKSSGFGRFGSHGLEEWVRTKNITFLY